MKRLKTLVSLLLFTLTSTLGQMNFDTYTQHNGPELLSSSSTNTGVWVPVSPCPSMFNYQWWGPDVIGVALVPPPIRSSDTEPIKVLVSLSLEALLSENYVGSLELHEDKNVVFSRLNNRDKSPIVYRIRFPLRDPIPELTKIEVNGITVCQGPPAVSSQSVVTLLNLDHTLYPGGTSLTANPAPVPPQVTRPNQRPQLPSWMQPMKPPGIVAEQEFNNFPPINKPPPFSPSQIQPTIDSAETQCGQVVKVQHLVVNGNDTERGEWPWLTAIFVTTNKGQDFQCGGSLVSVNHVITAAHCVKEPNSAAINPNRITVFLGKFNLFRAERNSQQRDISKIILHPSYGGGKYDNDVAILFLETPAQITVFVRPVCLWPEVDTSLENVLTKKGTVVGWGRDESGNRVSEQLKKVTMPLVTQEECLRSHYNFYYLTTNATYCAGGRDGSGPCNGDSGGGMYFPESTPRFGKRWMLRGVVSLSLQDENTKLCDLNNYIVFTDVAKFIPWIKQMTGLI